MLGRLATDAEPLNPGIARSLSAVSRLSPLALGALVALLLVVAWYVTQVVVLEYTARAALSATVEGVSVPVRPETPLHITASGAGVELLDARLFRSEAGAIERAVPVRLEPTQPAGSWQVATLDGAPLLVPDGNYRLVVHAAAPRPALPLPRTDVVEQQHRFTTVASPRASIPSDVLQPRWGDAVSFTWSLPMQSVSAAVEPRADLRTWVDPADPTRTWVQLAPESVVDGQTYSLTFAEGRSVDGLSVRYPASFQLAVPPRPRFVEVPREPVTLRLGETYSLKSSIELAGAQVTTSGDLPTRVAVERDQIRLALPEFHQGAELDLRVHSAVSVMGAPMQELVRVRVVTPPPLAAPEVAPSDGAARVQPSTHPSITFAEPVADRDAVVRSISMDPAVPGTWQWPAPDRVEFVPEGRLPILTSFDVTLRGGPDGPRAASGGYLDGDLSWSFKTTDFKRIDVSLGRQVMTLFEDEVPIRTIVVATGVPGAQTPTGNYEVQYKMPRAHFRGVNPSGQRYDIPDVNWVMAFFGDYTIHGAHWRTRFGIPGSAGCVSMTDADAKIVYDWADEGTPISIHS
jgi:hypothetical protein